MTTANIERRKDDRRIRELAECVSALDEKVSQLMPLLVLLDDSREAFKLFNKLMALVRWFIQKAMMPLLFIAGGIYAVAHHGRPPDWIKSWIDLFR